MKRNMNLDDMQFISNMAASAAEKYRECADTFRKLIDHTPDPDSMMQISGEAARRMAETFDAQAAQASHYCQLFSAITDDFTVEYDETMVEEDDDDWHEQAQDEIERKAACL